MTVYLFEDTSRTSLTPLTHLHPDFDLRCGIFTARERAGVLFQSASIALLVRDHLANTMSQRTGLRVNGRSSLPAMYLNGSALLNNDVVGVIQTRRESNVILRSKDATIAVIANDERFEDEVRSHIERWTELSGPVDEIDCPVIRYPWDVISQTRQMLINDADSFSLGEISPNARVSRSASLVSPERISIMARAEIGEGVVLDASDGPVIVDEGASIMHHAVIVGPAYIGKQSRVKIGAKVYPGTTIGPICKVGGEVEESVFHSFANKQHDGFVGHSYFAPWTNLGADTNTSDLKNNYSEIRTSIDGTEFRTGRQFLGTIMADHSKCGINTMFNTGTIVGVGCNIFGGGFPPKDIPSFSWGGPDGLQEYDFERFSETAEAVYQRRGVQLTLEERSLLAHVYQDTSRIRKGLIEEFGGVG